MEIIRINAIQFAEMCGHESGRILICDERNFFIGEKVQLEVWTTTDPRQTGAVLYRFVEDIEFLSTSRDEDTFYSLKLSALRPDVTGLKLGLIS